MAHISRVETNGTTDIRYEGRTFTRESTIARMAGKDGRRVCLLSLHGGDALEHWSVDQPCFGIGCRHRHVKRSTIDDLVKRGTVRWIGTGRNVAAYTYGREWRPTISAGYTTLQLR